MSMLLEHAQRYAQRGLSILPIGKEKQPTVRAWKRYQKEAASVGTLAGWFGRPNVTGLAVVCGAVSGGLVVRDFDAERAYAEWAERQPALAGVLPTVQTARGKHVYFVCPTCTGRNFVDGELRAEGQYVVMPPSRHPTGVAYAWIVPFTADGAMVIDDPVAAGLVPRSYGERGEIGEHRGIQRNTEITEAIGKRTLEAAIAATLPSGPGERHRALFRFCRELKAMPVFAEAPADPMRSAVENWHARALPFIRTKPFEETWIDFLKAWPRVRFPAGESPLDEILKLLRTTAPPPEAIRYEQTALQWLVALCRQLQGLADNLPFFLSVRTAARVLGVSIDTAHRWLFLLRSDGLLTETEKGHQGRASRYRYNGTLGQSEVSK